MTNDFLQCRGSPIRRTDPAGKFRTNSPRTWIAVTADKLFGTRSMRRSTAPIGRLKWAPRLIAGKAGKLLSFGRLTADRLRGRSIN